MHSFNVRAIEAARILNLPFTGGSDAHEAREAGSCYTEFNDKVTPDTLDSLKEGNYQGVDTRKHIDGILNNRLFQEFLIPDFKPLAGRQAKDDSFLLYTQTLFSLFLTSIPGCFQM
jgi:hypothetical protein